MEILLDQIDFGELLKDAPNVETGGGDNPPVEQSTENIFQTEESGFNPEELLEEPEDEGKTKLKKDETTQAPPPVSKTKTSKNEFPHSLVFQSLVEEEALSEFNEEQFKKDAAEFGEAVAIQNVYKRELDLNRQAILDQAEEDYKEYVALKDAGVDTKTAKELISNKMQFDTMKEDDVKGEDKLELRKQILTRNLELTTKFTAKEIAKQVNRAIASGEDEEDAVEALTNIKEITKQSIEAEKVKAKENEIAEKRKLDENAAKYHAAVDSLDEPVPGQKINKQTKDKVEKALFAGEAWKLREKDPYKFDAVLTYLVMNGAFEGKLTASTTKAKNEVFKQLESAIHSKSKPHEFRSNEYMPDEEESDDVLGFMRKMKK